MMGREIPRNWDDQGNFYLSRDWLAFADSDHIATSCYLNEGNSSLVAHYSPRENNPDYVPGLIFGGRRGYHSSVPAMHHVVSSMEKLAGQLGVNLEQWTWPFVSQADAYRLKQEIQQQLDPGKISVGLQGGECYLDISQGGFSELIDRLPTRQRRTNLRAEIRALSKKTAVVGITPFAQATEDLPALGALLSNVQQKYGHNHPPDMMTNMLARQQQYLGEKGVLFALYSDQSQRDILGFHLAYRHANTLWSRVVGFDYPRLEGIPAYTKLVFEMPVEYCVSQGLRAIELGMGSFEAKLRRGASFRPLFHVSYGTPRVETLQVSTLNQQLPKNEQLTPESLENSV